MIHRLLVPFVTCCLLLTAVSRASADDPINSALPAAQTWLSTIDAGKYEESYDMAGQGLYQKLPDKKDWVVSLKIVREAWGPIIDRKQAQHLYQPNGISGLNGECMAITFDTTTKKQGDVVEMVIMRLEDGKWRGVGYTVGAKSDPNATPAVPAAVTESSGGTVQNPAKAAYGAH